VHVISVGGSVHPVLKIVSGGQTGVDRAALDAALACGLPVGGWCPAGRRAEDGAIPERYPLVETPSLKYPQRTAWNVRDSDATLIVTLGELDSGSKLTADIARRTGKPCIVASLDSYPRLIALAEILPMGRPEVVLNVAGPRESRRPGIYARAFGFLVTVFRVYEKAGFELKLTPAPPAAAPKTIGRANGRPVVREPSATVLSLF
jgi:hypothetical protein